MTSVFTTWKRLLENQGPMEDIEGDGPKMDERYRGTTTKQHLRFAWDKLKT